MLPYRHRHSRWHSLAGEERYQRYSLSNATARAILRNRSRRAVHMDAPVLHEVFGSVLGKTEFKGGVP